METGGQAAIRGFLVQTLIALLEQLEDGKSWQSVTLEPNIESDKVDILWKYPDRSKAVQVKSSRNPFKRSDIERWAKELESSRKADEYQLVLVGTPESDSVARIRRSGLVSIPSAKNLDIQAFKEQAAFRLEHFLGGCGLAPGDPSRRMMLVEALAGNLATLASTGKELTKGALVELLTGWVSPATVTIDTCARSCTGPTVRLVKVFVSGPEDVSEECAQVDRICISFNRTDGQLRGLRLEAFQWDRDGLPQIGPGRIQVMDAQTPDYEVFIGILSARFGKPAGKNTGGTEMDFKKALERWNEVGKPWIMFYFNDQPAQSSDPAKVSQFLKVCKFRKKLETIGLVGAYKGLHGSQDGFYEKVSEHLRMVVNRLPLIERKPGEKPSKPRQKGACSRGSFRKPLVKPTVPPEYRDWLLGECGEMELMGLQPKEGIGVLLHQVYTPLITWWQAGGWENESLATGWKQESPRSWKVVIRQQLLLDLLAEESLYVSGDPGSGKSVFCRWVAWLLCKEFIPPESEDTAAPERYREKFPQKLRGRLPVLVRLRDFWTHLQPPGKLPVGLSCLETAFEGWLSALGSKGLDWACLRAHLEYGSTVLLLDGVDEVPPAFATGGVEWSPRETLLDALTEALKRWTGAGNRVLLTSRFYGLQGYRQKKLGLSSAPIQGMDEELQSLLARRWFVQLRVDRKTGLGEAAALMEHLGGVRGLDNLAANPLLLTALCIVYNEGKRLPEDKYELYDRIVDTVLHKRYSPDNRVRVTTIRGRLGAIALGMHTGEAAGLQRESPEATVPWEELDLLLCKYRQWDGATDKEFTDAVNEREELLSQSGLLVPEDGKKATFYHLSIQEFLAAERLFILMGLRKVSGATFLLERGECPGWRNTLGFLFGCLVSKYNPSVGVELLREVLRDSVISEVEPVRWGRESSVWNVALVLGDCLEVLMGRGATVPGDLREFHERVALRAIEQEIEAKDRHSLTVVLGRLGDPRIVEDLRVEGLPDEHRGYVKITLGKYVYSEVNEQIVIAEPFWLTRYPVTNSQYALFMKEGGYMNFELWSQDGLDWLRSEGVSQPRLWRHPNFSGPNQPVVGVSYWEAEAFARFARGCLPSARQWEAAARGREGGVYPWGNDWEDGICNSWEARLGCTSAVGVFPRSRSREFGLDDMAGNVWEWCVDVAGDEASLRVVCGGSWFNDPRFRRSSNHFLYPPSYRNSNVGFRVALVPPGK